MKSIGPVIASLALAACALAAETAHERGKRVVNEALQAVGGKAFLAMEDRVETGRAYSFFRQELEGLSIAKIYTRYVTPGARKALRPRAPEFRQGRIERRVLFNQDGAWEITFRGARLLEPKRIENWRDGTLRNIFYILRQRLNEPGMDFYSRGSDLYENLPVEIVDITDVERPHGDGVFQRVHQAAGAPGAEAPQSRVTRISTPKRRSSPNTAMWAAA